MSTGRYCLICDRSREYSRTWISATRIINFNKYLLWASKNEYLSVFGSYIKQENSWGLWNECHFSTAPPHSLGSTVCHCRLSTSTFASTCCSSSCVLQLTNTIMIANSTLPCIIVEYVLLISQRSDIYSTMQYSFVRNIDDNDQLQSCK